jgi:hypothetical protein
MYIAVFVKTDNRKRNNNVLADTHRNTGYATHRPKCGLPYKEKIVKNSFA